MGYAHINNLYKDQTVLIFKECYAMEKVHGTSSHIIFNPIMDKDGYIDLTVPSKYELKLFAGGEKHERFITLFDQELLKTKISEIVSPGAKVIVYGEAYGGSQQGMSYLYSKELKFIAFEVKINDHFLSVPDAEKIVIDLGLEFVHYTKIPTTLEALDAERDKDSVQAVRNGVDLTNLPKDKTAIREGIVLRPLIELTKNNGDRILSKHKSDKFNERKTVQKIIDPDKLQILKEANAISEEWVTINRLEHVLQKLPQDISMESVPIIIKAMLEDVLREAAGEIIDSKEARKAISSKTVQLFKQRLQDKLKEQK